ncbi:MAG TPA: CDGSH iron-sulfur domain-containing protein [Chitinophagales bacterium]
MTGEELLETKKDEAVIVTLKPHGAVAINGTFILIDEDGNEQKISGRVSICRCGLSQKMPICDGTHKAIPR